MSKAILVMDMPSKCKECPCCYITEGSCKDVCKVDYEVIENADAKPSWCPLREVPEKHEEIPYGISPMLDELYTDYDKGYNACIDEILGKDV